MSKITYEGIWPPTKYALDSGYLDDDPDLPVDVRAARAWHRGMALRGVASHSYLRDLRMSVRFAVDEAVRSNSYNPDLREAHHRLAALITYADAARPLTPAFACADCGEIVFTANAAFDHHPDDPDHGGWDPIYVNDTDWSL